MNICSINVHRGVQVDVNKQESYLTEMLPKYEEHIGHKVQYFSDGHVKNYGVLERVSVLNIGEDKYIQLWLRREDGEIFPKWIGTDQLIGCICQLLL
jgi:hypothetical protein